MRRRRRAWLDRATPALLLALLGGCEPSPGGRTEEAAPPSERWRAYARIVAVEDARGVSPLDPLLTELSSPDGAVRAWAARGLARLAGSPGLDDVARTALPPLLRDPAPGVRIEAAHALAAGVLPADEVVALLEGAFETEAEPLVRAELAHAAVRARPDDPGDLPVDVLEEPATLPAVRLAVARTWAALRRAQGAGLHIRSDLLPRVEDLAAKLPEPDDDIGARIRRLAVASLGPQLSPDVAQRALRDPDPGVRRTALVTLSEAAALEAAYSLVGDPDPGVRVEAVRQAARWARSGDGDCAVFLEAVSDPSVSVALMALDRLASPCPDDAAQIELLTFVLDEDPPLEEWHRPAHALVALAAMEPDAAAAGLDRFTRHASPFARMYAARAAAALEDEALLRRMARDPHPNVRTEAVMALARLVGHEADDVYIAQLASDDVQLLRVAARALRGATDPAPTAEALVDALLRVTNLRSESSRDARMAILGTLQELLPELDGAAFTDRLQPLARDFDLQVAQAAARLVSALFGTPVEARPDPLPSLPTPSAAELEALSRQSVVLEMALGGEIEILMRPDLAATNAWRFASLVRGGYYDGLTFHRVEPNFVLQGGSPGANEYAGHPRFSRDELGANGHWAGTVGLSTRGRDTGDIQLFVNLVDNNRLDGQYTVFGEVVRGMEVVLGVLEGDVIRRATVRER